MSPQSLRSTRRRKRRRARPSKVGRAQRPTFERRLLPRPCRTGAGRGGSCNSRACARALPPLRSSVDRARGPREALRTIPNYRPGKKGGNAARISHDQRYQAGGRRSPRPAQCALQSTPSQDQAGIRASPVRRRRLCGRARSARLTLSAGAARSPTPARRPGAAGTPAAGRSEP